MSGLFIPGFIPGLNEEATLFLVFSAAVVCGVIGAYFGFQLDKERATASRESKTLAEGIDDDHQPKERGESRKIHANLRAYHVLKRNVLSVAVRKEDRWVAYVGEVPGDDHDREASDVIKSGEILSEIVARPMFDEPPWSDLPYGEA